MPNRITRRANTDTRNNAESVEQTLDERGLLYDTAGQELRCIECKHCLFERIDCDGPLMPCCKNPASRSYDHGLDLDAAACHLFEAVPTGTAYRLKKVGPDLNTPSERPQKDMHEAIIKIAGLVLLAIAVAQVVKVELLELFR